MLYRKYKLLPGLWNVYWYIITDLDILLFFSVKNTFIRKETIINVILQTNNFFMNGVKVLFKILFKTQSTYNITFFMPGSL